MKGYLEYVAYTDIVKKEEFIKDNELWERIIIERPKAEELVLENKGVKNEKSNVLQHG